MQTMDDSLKEAEFVSYTPLLLVANKRGILRAKLQWAKPFCCG